MACSTIRTVRSSRRVSVPPRCSRPRSARRADSTSRSTTGRTSRTRATGTSITSRCRSATTGSDMRGLVVLVLLVGGPAFAESEHYEQIRVDAGMTGSSVGVSDRNAVGFVTEIKVNAHDNIAVGGRVEIAVMFGGNVGAEELPFGLAASALAKGEYLLGTGPVRPFAGIGAGLYSMGTHTIV